MRHRYPMGSISSGTMREDLIPAFTAELGDLAAVKRNPPIGDVSAKTRKAHLQLVREIEEHSEISDAAALEFYYDSEISQWDLDALCDALNEYAGPYFFFGSNPGDGADYGYWLSEGWDEDFISISDPMEYYRLDACKRGDFPRQIKVSDLNDVPKWFRGEVAVANDHGNVTLYVKTSRALREIWSVV